MPEYLAKLCFRVILFEMYNKQDMVSPTAMNIAKMNISLSSNSEGGEERNFGSSNR